jgi:hypothetical protein
MEKTATQIVFLNSASATTYNNSTTTYLSDVSFYLSRPITRPKDTILALRLDTFFYSNSFYVVDSTNNTITAEGEDYTIATGNYTVDTLKDALDTAFNGDYTVTYDNTKMKYTITGAAGTEFVLAKESTCLSLLGFSSTDHVSDNTGVLTSDLVVNLTKTKNVYVDVQNLSINNLNATTGQRTTALCPVPVLSSPGDYVFYENVRGSYVYLQEDTINNLRVRVYEEDLSSLVNFQGQNWTMSLEFSFVEV